MELFALAVAAVAAVFAILLTPLARRIAERIDFVDRPGERKIHGRTVAYGGGVAVFISCAMTLVLAAQLPRWWPQLGTAREDLRGPTLIVVACGALGALLLGLVDDKYRLSPRVKLIFQFLLAIGAVAGGVRITALVGDTWFMRAATVLWIVLLTNSFNLLDNMDGLCAGAAAIAAGLLGRLALESSQWYLAFGLAALAGSCLGFLKHNRAPASIFLGDAGSLLIGYLLACFTVLVTYYHYREPSHLAVGIPLLVLAIPLYDTFSVIVIRLREGRPIMRGDTCHFSHRLVDLGMTRNQAVGTIHLACLAIGLPATVLGQLPEAAGFLIIGQAVLVLTIIALLESAGRAKALSAGSQPTTAVASESTATAGEESPVL